MTVKYMLSLLSICNTTTSYILYRSDAFMLLCLPKGHLFWFSWGEPVIIAFTVGEACRANWNGQWWSICTFQWKPICQSYSLMTAHVVSIHGSLCSHCPSTNEAKSPSIYLRLLEGFVHNLEPEHSHIDTHTNIHIGKSITAPSCSPTPLHPNPTTHTAYWLRDVKHMMCHYPYLHPTILQHRCWLCEKMVLRYDARQKYEGEHEI